MDDGVRDLARDELWRESIERSRARRVGSTGRSSAPVVGSKRRLRAPSRRAVVERRRRVALGGTGMSALALVVAVLPGVLGGPGAGRGVRAARAATLLARQGGPTYASSGGVAALAPGGPTSGSTKLRQPPRCQAAVGSSNYFNPLAAAHVTPERIDQGVDYAGSGTLGAIGAAKITYLSMSGTGWPGAFIEYRLLDGTDAGCYVYYAEGVKPAPGLKVGVVVGPGQPVATIIQGWSTGVELGWGAGVATLTYAAARHQWDARSDADSKASPAGKSFSALVGSLGGPPGKIEG